MSIVSNNDRCQLNQIRNLLHEGFSSQLAIRHLTGCGLARESVGGVGFVVGL